MVRVGIVGTGNWGRHHVRVFAGLDGARLVRIADRSEERLARAARSAPGVDTTTDPARVLEATDVDAVVVATSASTHVDLAARALAAGKDVLVEKPLALSARAADGLVAAAREGERVLMVGHLLLHHPAVVELRRLVASGELGTLRYLCARRVNLGTVRSEENVLWSLAPHDLSVMLDLVGAMPESVAARGEAWIHQGVEDVVFLNLRWPGRRMGQITVSWLDPHKERCLTVVGDRRMAVFDDMHPSEKIRIYDKGVDPPGEAVGSGEALSVRFGEVRVPRLAGSEPLVEQARHFVEQVARRGVPRGDGDEGRRVVEILEAASRSLAADGRPVALVCRDEAPTGTAR